MAFIATTPPIQPQQNGDAERRIQTAGMAQLSSLQGCRHLLGEAGDGRSHPQPLATEALDTGYRRGLASGEAAVSHAGLRCSLLARAWPHQKLDAEHPVGFHRLHEAQGLPILDPETTGATGATSVRRQARRYGTKRIDLSTRHTTTSLPSTPTSGAERVTFFTEAVTHPEPPPT